MLLTNVCADFRLIGFESLIRAENLQFSGSIINSLRLNLSFSLSQINTISPSVDFGLGLIIMCPSEHSIQNRRANNPLGFKKLRS